MTVIKPNISQLGAGVRIDLGAAGDDAVIKKSVFIVSTDDSGIEGSGPGHLVTVSGTVQSVEGSGVILGNDPVGATGNRLVVTQTGEVSGAFSTLAAGAIVYGNGLLLDNAGTITGAIGFGFGVDAGKTAVLENNGTIFASLGVTRIGGLGVGRLINTGVIEGFGTSYAGEFISGPLVARDVVINSGLMRGDVVLGSGDDLYVAQKGGRVVGTIEGGEGNDRFVLGARAESVDGGSGSDIVDFRNGGPVKIALDGAFANTGAAAGDDYTDIDQVWGSAQGDKIRGSSEPETLRGFAGEDTLIGGGGFDFLIGGKGRDVLSGGGGPDIFTFFGPSELGDRITDFNSASDLILLSGSAFGFAGFGPAASEFRSRGDNVAQDGNDHFIFRTTDKSLWWDKDGQGGNGPVLIVDLQQTATVTVNDIYYVLL